MKQKVTNKKIELRNQTISFSLRTSFKAKNLRIEIHPKHGLKVIKPLLMSERAVNRFIKKKANWILKHLELVRNRKGFKSRDDWRDYIKNKDKAYELVWDRLEYFNQSYKLKFNRVYIKRQKTRWGSCSSKRNLNFNFRIVFLNQHLADYIIVHELCHLKEMNHSQRFWSLVARSIPDYKQARRKLRKMEI